VEVCPPRALASARLAIDRAEAPALAQLDAQFAALFHTKDFQEGRDAEAQGRLPSTWANEVAALRAEVPTAIETSLAPLRRSAGGCRCVSLVDQPHGAQAVVHADRRRQAFAPVVERVAQHGEIG
jgi:hypothetical protein